MQKTFPIGTVVRLRSGGPNMTVVDRSDDGVVVETKWFDGNEVQFDRFQSDTLLVINSTVDRLTSDDELREARRDPKSFVCYVLERQGVRYDENRSRIQDVLTEHPWVQSHYPSGFGVTTQVVLRMVWEIAHDPTIRIGVVERDGTVSTWIKKYLTSPVVREVFPSLLLPTGFDRVFTVGDAYLGRPTVQSMIPMTSVRGSRFDVVIFHEWAGEANWSDEQFAKWVSRVVDCLSENARLIVVTKRNEELDTLPAWLVKRCDVACLWNDALRICETDTTFSKSKVTIANVSEQTPSALGYQEQESALWVSVIVRDPSGNVLTSERLDPGSIDCGRVGVPGGKVRVGESIVGAAIRELKEETGTNLMNPSLYGFSEADDRGVVFFVTGTIGDQVPERLEPKKHGPWTYTDISDRSTLQVSLRERDSIVVVAQRVFETTVLKSEGKHACSMADLVPGDEIADDVVERLRRSATPAEKKPLARRA